ncbi:spore protein [Bacillus horti]|uniref:Uncharacterized protein n=1 Tax=Caldalkalibacillus horti TaxID=77523 RepID=A0ABT9W3N5_9BACI|nr:spore protein [Bacillus horti]MDQ0167853.1 hypothetical protein [Bacillus horti]
MSKANNNSSKEQIQQENQNKRGHDRTVTTTDKKLSGPNRPST